MRDGLVPIEIKEYLRELSRGLQIITDVVLWQVLDDVRDFYVHVIADRQHLFVQRGKGFARGDIIYSILHVSVVFERPHDVVVFGQEALRLVAGVQP